MYSRAFLYLAHLFHNSAWALESLDTAYDQLRHRVGKLQKVYPIYADAPTHSERHATASEKTSNDLALSSSMTLGENSDAILKTFGHIADGSKPPDDPRCLVGDSDGQHVVGESGQPFKAAGRTSDACTVQEENENRMLPIALLQDLGSSAGSFGTCISAGDRAAELDHSLSDGRLRGYRPSSSASLHDHHWKVKDGRLGGHRNVDGIAVPNDHFALGGECPGSGAYPTRGNGIGGAARVRPTRGPNERIAPGEEGQHSCGGSAHTQQEGVASGATSRRAAELDQATSLNLSRCSICKCAMQAPSIIAMDAGQAFEALCPDTSRKEAEDIFTHAKTSPIYSTLQILNTPKSNVSIGGSL